MRMRPSASRGRPSTTRWAAEVGLAGCEGRPSRRAEQEVTSEPTEVPADRVGAAGRVREHTRLTVGAPQFELGARAVDDSPPRPGNRDPKAVLRTVHAVL